MKQALVLLGATLLLAVPTRTSAQSPPPGYRGSTPTTQLVQPAPSFPPAARTPYSRPQLGSRSQPVTSRPNLGLTITGAVMLGVSWLVHGALVSPLAGCDPFESCDPEWSDMRWTGVVPLAGPWIQLAILPTALGNDSWAPYLVVDGLLQAGGLTLLILGLALRETRGQYATLPSLDVAVVPRVGVDGGGVAVVGTL